MLDVDVAEADVVIPAAMLDVDAEEDICPVPLRLLRLLRLLRPLAPLRPPEIAGILSAILDIFPDNSDILPVNSEILFWLSLRYPCEYNWFKEFIVSLN